MEKIVKKIVLTGGPCAGKTTALNWIQNNFEKQGYKIIYVPEEATELINSGIKPWESTQILDFQTTLMRLQIEKEDAFVKATEYISEDKFLIICDRGLLDTKAYLSDEDFEICLKRNNLTIEEARARYDACIHLVTAAIGAEEYYNLDNAARTETIEQARELDEKTLRAWLGHPHLRIIANEPEERGINQFERKMINVMNEIAKIIGVPGSFATERKFLIEKPDEEQLAKLDNCECVSIIQTYLTSENAAEETKVRQRGSKGSYTYMKTKKKYFEDNRVVETETRLTKDEYLESLTHIDPNTSPIVKKRYCLYYKNQYLEIDIYPHMKETAICEIELPSTKQRIKIPPYLGFIEEVTNKEEYKNYEISKNLKKEI